MKKLLIIEKNRKILSNISYLSLLEILSLLIPIIIYPFLVDCLGVSLYGEIIYAQSIIGMLVIVTSWGLNTIGNKEVSGNREDKEYINFIFSHVFYIKIVFFCILIFLYLIFFSLFEFDINNKLYLFTFWIIIYDIFFPIWYFQGLENMKTMAYIITSSRFLFLVCIFSFITKPSDYLYYPLSNFIGVIFCIICGLYFIFVKDKRSFVRIDLAYSLKLFKLGAPVFLSGFMGVFMANCNKIVLGNFVGMSGVTIYDFLEKILTLAKIPSTIIRQSLFPTMNMNRQRNIFPLLFWGAIVNVFIILLIHLFDHYIIDFFLGRDFLHISNLLFFYSWIILISYISSYLMYLKLIPYEIKYSRFIFMAIFAYSLLILFGILFDRIDYHSIIIITIFIEFFIASSFIFLFYKKVIR